MPVVSHASDIDNPRLHALPLVAHRVERDIENARCWPFRPSGEAAAPEDQMHVARAGAQAGLGRLLMRRRLHRWDWKIGGPVELGGLSYLPMAGGLEGGPTSGRRGGFIDRADVALAFRSRCLVVGEAWLDVRG